MTRSKTHICSTARDSSRPLGPKGVEYEQNIENGNKLKKISAVGTKTVRIDEKMHLMYLLSVWKLILH